MNSRRDDPETDQHVLELNEIRGSDAMFLKGETDLRTRQTGHSLYLLDSIPEWDRFFAVWERASRILPPLHHRVVQPPGPGRLPVWQFDPDLDLRFHVRRLAVPSPGTMREVLDIAENDGMVPLDHVRPLWQATLLEGLEGDRAALLLKFHHLWVDGRMNIEVARLIYETGRDGDLGRSMPSPPTPPEPDQASLLDKTVREMRKAAGRSISAYGDALRRGARAAANPRQTISESGELLASARRVFTPPSTERSTLIAERSFKSRFDTLDVPFADLRRAVKSVGCTINDGYMAGVTGCIRLYHERLNSHVDEVGIAMPLSTRSDDKLQTGNQFSAAMLAFPVSVVDPVERLHRIREIVKNHRQEKAADLFMSVSQFFIYVPEQLYPNVMAQLFDTVDFNASQVPGMMEPRYIAGAQLTHYYGFGPRLGVAAFFGMMTHLDNCCIGVHSDPAAIRDPELFMECLSDAFDEILAFGRDCTGIRKSPGRKRTAAARKTTTRKKATPKKAAPKPAARQRASPSSSTRKQRK